MSFKKKITLLFILPILILGSITTLAFIGANNHYKSERDKISKADNKVITKNANKYYDYAFSKGQTTINNATIQANLNNGEYTTSGFLNGKAVSVNTSDKPTIVNGKTTVYSLTSKHNEYLANAKAVKKAARVSAEFDRELDTFREKWNSAYAQFIVYVIIIIVVLLLYVGWINYLIISVPENKKSN